jgi:dienelactone hydrolase
MAPHAYERSAERLRALGYFVVFADYLKRRGLESCAAAVSMDAAGQDAVEAAAWLRAQSGIDAKRVSVIGWSFGGGAVLAALARTSAERIPFSRAVVYYPACVGTRPWTIRIPLLVLFAGDDSTAPRSLCADVLEAKRDDPGIRQIVYPGAQHGFDMEGLPPKLKYGFGAVGYDPQAAAAAWAEVVAFLKARK